MRTDEQTETGRQTDMMNLIVAFRNLANAANDNYGNNDNKSKTRKSVRKGPVTYF
jgi:hypothetical protein